MRSFSPALVIRETVVPVRSGEAARSRSSLFSDRGRDRKTWRADLESLPDGTVVIGTDGQARLVLGDHMLAFSFGGWTRPEARTVTDVVEVLTPPTSVRALASGFTPVLHPTAGR